MSFRLQPAAPARPNRCQLFGPGSRPELFAKMAGSAADVINLDLEDSVAPDDKEQARKTQEVSLPRLAVETVRDFVPRALEKRIDLGYEDYGIAVEYDGRDHIRREEQWHSDIARREELDDDWKFIVLTSRDIHRKQAQTAERVHQAPRARGYKGPFDPLGWRRHFAP